MEDIVLKTTLDDSSSLYISPIDPATYAEHVTEDNLGGGNGYFVLLSRSLGVPSLEVLAKAPTLEAATALFDLIVSMKRGDRAAEHAASYSLAPLFL